MLQFAPRFFAHRFILRRIYPPFLKRWVALASLLLAITVPSGVSAEEVVVPVGLQAELLTKVAAYDKNLIARAGDKVHVLILTRAADADSSRAAAQMQTSLASIASIAGLPHDEVVTTFTGGAQLAALIRDRHIAILYVAPGLGPDVEAIRAALDGADVLSASAVPEYVPRGIVLGFDLVSGKPKLLVQLTQARRQHVALKAEVLKIMKVYE